MHLLSSRQFDKNDVLDIFSRADNLRINNKDLKSKILATVFYEPSTRTRLSFEAAMLRCGGSYLTMTEKLSSAEKGESLADTLKVVSQYADIIALRHPDIRSEE